MTRLTRGVHGRLLAGYLAVILLLALTWGVAALGASRMASGVVAAVESNDRLLANVTQRIKLMEDKETSLRGYLLTRDPAFLGPYARAQRLLPGLRARDDQLSGNHSALRPLLTAMERRAKSWDQWAQPLLSDPPAQVGQPGLRLQQRQGKALFDRFRVAAMAVSTAVTVGRQHNLSRSQQIATRMNMLSAVIFLVALLLTVFMAWLTIRAITQPLERLREAADAITRGDLTRPVVVSGAQEFGALAGGMELMRAQLERDASLRAETEETLREHASRLSSIVQTQAAIAAAGPDLDTVLTLVTDRACQLTSADGAVVELVEGNEMVYRAASGTAAPHVGLRLRSDTSLSGMCAQTGEILRCDDTEIDPRVDREACRRIGARSMIVVPLLHTGTVAGVLKVLSPARHAFDKHDVYTLQLMASEIASTMRTASEFEAKQALLAERTRASQELERTNAELETFAYSVSHDLRTPLRSVDGFSQILLDRYADKLDAAGRRYLTHVRGAAQDMGHLIDALLALSRVTRGELRRERVDLTALAHSIAADLREDQPGRDATLVIDDCLTVDGDARLLQAALANLLGNAWKFTAGRPHACIEFGMTRRGGQPVYVVRDNGAGFDMTYAGKLFTPFQRLHSVGEFQGTGVGLATVQRIIHRHGGQVWAEGAVDQGASFYFPLESTNEERE